MLAVLLSILKIIGILLLSILGLFVLVVCLVLFVPIRYRVQAANLGAVSAHAKVSWLLHILTIHASFENSEFGVYVKIFGREWKKKEPKAKRASREKEKPVEKEKTQAAVKPTAKPEEQPVQKEISQERMEKQEAVPEKKKETLLQKIQKFLQAVKKGFKNIRYTLETICDKIKEIRDNMERYYRILNEEYTKNTWTLCVGQLQRTLRHIRPKRFQASVHFGTGDPETTGQILAVYCAAVYPWTGSSIQVSPDFENTIFEGNFDMKGRMRIVVFISVLWKLYFNKDLKQLIHIMKERNEE